MSNKALSKGNELVSKVSNKVDVDDSDVYTRNDNNVATVKISVSDLWMDLFVREDGSVIVLAFNGERRGKHFDISQKEAVDKIVEAINHSV